MTCQLRSSGARRRLLTASVVCCLLVLAGCGQSRQGSTPEFTPIPTAQALPTSSPLTHIITLRWSQAALPPGFGMEFHVSDIGVAPSDGDIAYACTTTLFQPYQTKVVVTHDGGASWGPVTNINVNFGGCAETPR